MQAFEKPFKEYWATTVYPAIKDDFERLLQTTPKRIAKKHERDTAEKAEKAEKIKEQAENQKEKKNKSEEENAPELQQPEGKNKEKQYPVRTKITSIFEEAKDKGERRNAYMNLAWTGPIDNTYLHEKISLAKVERIAADMFLDCIPTAAAPETALESLEASDDGDTPLQSKAEQRAVETLSQTPKRPWQIPRRVEKGFEIPIMISGLFPEPDIGAFKRLGMDVVVNAVWLAYFWAKEERSIEAAKAIEELILDWPFDVIDIKGTSPDEIEENKFKWAVNMTARVERLRDFVGVDNANLLRIVARAVDFVAAKSAAGNARKPRQRRSRSGCNST